MSKLDDLLQGVKVDWLPLEDVANFRRGSFPQPYGNREWYDGEGSMPFIQVNDVGFNLKLVDEPKNRISKKAQPKSIFVRQNTVIVTLQGSIGRVAITQYDSYVDRTLAIFEKYKIDIDLKYFAYQLEAKFNIEKEKARGNIIKTITKEDFKKFQIPIPCPDNPEKSLEIQHEIVRILDQLTETTNNLKTELENERQIRKKQFEFYREQLFTFKDNETNLINLGNDSIGEFIRGSGLQKKDFTNTGVGCIHYGQLYTHYKTYAFETKSFVSEEFASKARKASTGDLIIATTSENDDDVCKAVAWLGNEDIAVSSDACFYRHKFNPKYVAYYFQTENFQKQKRKFITGTKVRRVNVNDLSKILIPNPSLEEQERIVNLLDQFNTAHTAIEEELTNEIKLRTQQYEYYREKLLTF